MLYMKQYTYTCTYNKILTEILYFVERRQGRGREDQLNGIGLKLQLEHGLKQRFGYVDLLVCKTDFAYNFLM